MTGAMMSDEAAFVLLKSATSVNTFDLMQRIIDVPPRLAPTISKGLLMTAVAHGTLDGVVDWMVAHLGAHTTYELLQRRADALAAGVIKGSDGR